ncbi:MAG: glucosyl-3-phosphoglycerate synthase [Candidatus Mcinerneyibacterium aminivorans]|uniref:Glucosyl-3-phosphoglycerate synthase n=1 Tax=Candidatus Mcinerneyibacterium aminivorans TaxID=2703815 RepID=A0A5D0MJM1_9BACT|nr:MAG: glucosyl-3-phosphoglycerate synthase [Candidatus Mcinerneyibacterium aminivorans]
MISNKILENTYHHLQFSDFKRLVELKQKQELKISMALPTLNEEKTIAKEVLIIKNELMDRFPLLDEIVVIDSGSEDNTRELAAEYGATVFSSEKILPRYGFYKGKGENLWKSLYVLKGDIIVWIDADIDNIHPKFVYGLVGALLMNPGLSYVKSFYERPITGKKSFQPSGGGRVTEIQTRPMFSAFYPELATVIQPLSGEYAGRREILENLSFSVGYGVETAHLIDIFENYGIDKIGQVDLDMRIHRNQSIQALSKMSFALLKTALRRLEKYGKLKLNKDMGKDHVSIEYREKKHHIKKTEIEQVERPPMVKIPEYCKKFNK